jgi:hypothetical protein
MYPRKKPYLSLLTTTVILIAQSNFLAVSGQTNYVVSNKKTQELMDNGWDCEAKLVRNDRYVFNFKVVGWSCLTVPANSSSVTTLATSSKSLIHLPIKIAN